MRASTETLYGATSGGEFCLPSRHFYFFQHRIQTLIITFAFQPPCAFNSNVKIVSFKGHGIDILAVDGILAKDRFGYFISESSVYRILKARGLVRSPVYRILSAADQFEHPTARVNELWQTDFTYFKIINWGWYYLLSVLDDYSRYIIAWRLCTGMGTDEVKKTLDVAIAKTGITGVHVYHRPRLLSDNGPSFISSELKDYLSTHGLGHTRTRPYHPMTQGKIERYHRSMKNLILLENYYTPEQLSHQVGRWVDYYNNHRYHEAINNVTPSDRFFGRDRQILKRREKIKADTMRQRRKLNREMALMT